jgi:hypothetical protein
MLQLEGGVGLEIILEPWGQHRHGHIGVLLILQKDGDLSGTEPI